MGEKLKKVLGFPYPKEYERGFNQDLMKKMHKPLLVAICAILLFVAWLVGICVFMPDTMGPEQYVRGILLIHFMFLIFTILTLAFTVSFRRQLFQHPKMHLLLCNIYAIGICLWATFLSAYASYSPAIYTAFIFVTLCVSMVSLFKPGLAIVVFVLNYAAYMLLLHIFSPAVLHNPAQVGLLYNSALAALVGMVIAIAFYRYRTRTYYDKLIIEKQIREIDDINRQLQRLVHIDNLTGLYNRRFYAEKMPDILADINKKSPVCCMMFDIDYFKRYNDQYGHPAGDEALRSISGIIKNSLAEYEAYAVRYGDEELLVLAAVKNEEQAMEVASAICRGAEDAYIAHAGSPYGKITLSCGLAYCDKGGACPLEEITKRADEALYRSKDSGRNKVTLFSSKK